MGTGANQLAAQATCGMNCTSGTVLGHGATCGSLFSPWINHQSMWRQRGGENTYSNPSTLLALPQHPTIATAVLGGAAEVFGLTEWSHLGLQTMHGMPSALCRHHNTIIYNGMHRSPTSTRLYHAAGCTTLWESVG